MNSSFLVDVNLPKFFNFFNSDKFIFVSDINIRMSDTEIWDYALENKLIILTKDADFFNRFLIQQNYTETLSCQMIVATKKTAFIYHKKNIPNPNSSD